MSIYKIIAIIIYADIFYFSVSAKHNLSTKLNAQFKRDRCTVGQETLSTSCKIILVTSVWSVLSLLTLQFTEDTVKPSCMSDTQNDRTGRMMMPAAAANDDSSDCCEVSYRPALLKYHSRFCVSMCGQRIATMDCVVARYVVCH